MFGPTRFLYGIRPNAPAGVLAAAVAVVLVFSSTPFLIPAISEQYGVSEGMAGAISVAQVGAFALVNFAAPRLLVASGRFLRLAALALFTINLLSIVPGHFVVLVGLRVLAGAAAGMMSWLAWADAMRVQRSMTAIAATGPVTALLSAPILATLSDISAGAIYLALAAASLPAVLFHVSFDGDLRVRREVSRSRSNRVLLAALFILTFAGAALFVYLAVAARDIHGLSATAASIGYSLNAAGGLLGARLASRHRRPGWWLASAGPAALLTVLGGPAGYYVGMAWWGFAFWMGVPGVLQMLARRSLARDERAGDAQGMMAAGRALGPVLGGGFADAGHYTALAVVAGSGITLSGLMIAGVQEGRERLPPTDPRTVPAGTNPKS